MDTCAQSHFLPLAGGGAEGGGGPAPPLANTPSFGDLRPVQFPPPLGEPAPHLMRGCREAAEGAAQHPANTSTLGAATNPTSPPTSPFRCPAPRRGAQTAAIRSPPTSLSLPTTSPLPNTPARPPPLRRPPPSPISSPSGGGAAKRRRGPPNTPPAPPPSEEPPTPLHHLQPPHSDAPRLTRSPDRSPPTSLSPPTTSPLPNTPPHFLPLWGSLPST